MKKIIILGCALSSICFTNLAQANFFFHASDPNACNYITGTWDGYGQASNWVLTCEYNGAGTISTVDENGDFSILIAADKRSGSFMCPQHFEHTLQGTCINGEIAFKTNYGDLEGDFSENAGTAQGTLSVAGIKTTVQINFQRTF